MSASVWWSLRDQLKRTMPLAVSVGYLSTVLKQKPGSANIVLRNLVRMGLVDDDGRPTDLANRWRDDEQYSAACSEIRDSVYPQELRDAVPGPEVDRRSAERWFTQNRRVGAGAAKNLAVLYILVSEAKLPGTRESATRPSEPRGVSQPRSTRPAAPASARPLTGVRGHFQAPDVRIAVQVNLDPNMTPEQIEHVFATMAKHFYGKN